MVFESALEREAVDDGCEHPHVVAGHLIDAVGGMFHSAVNVAAADDNADLHAKSLHLADFLGITANDIGIDPEILLPHQRFTADFEKDARVFKSLCHGQKKGLNRS